MRPFGLRATMGRWSDQRVPLVGRIQDPGGIWVRCPRRTKTLIVWRGYGSRSVEAQRKASPSC